MVRTSFLFFDSWDIDGATEREIHELDGVEVSGDASVVDAHPECFKDRY